jgi:hypothetical protein
MDHLKNTGDIHQILGDELTFSPYFLSIQYIRSKDMCLLLSKVVPMLIHLSRGDSS